MPPTGPEGGVPSLEGIRVVDLSRLLPGPVCTWYLHGLGAEVVKVEDPAGGDPLRYLPPVGPDGLGAWFRALHGGKRSVTLDLKDPSQVAQLERLLADADVLVEGFRPGVLARLGIDPEHLLAKFPRLVIASITGFGQTGPYRLRPGHDLGYLSLAGVMGLSGRVDGSPRPLPVQLADVMGGGLSAAFSIAAALFQRERTGQGRWLDVSMTHASLALVGPLLAQLDQEGTIPGPGEGLLTGGLPSYDVYVCADDRFVAVAALEPKFQQVLEQLTGVDPRNRETLRSLFLTRSRDEWASRLGDACVEPVLELSELADHPVFANGPYLVGDETGTVLVPPIPGGRAVPVLRAPRLGEHNDEILYALDDVRDPATGAPATDERSGS